MPDLSVEVRGEDIIVTKPSQRLAVTYRRAGPMMVALDRVPDRLGREEAAFLVRAWKAVYDRAKTLGWLQHPCNADRRGAPEEKC
jgi:hypothetical protein